MRPDINKAIDFYKSCLIEKGFSGNIKWLFRENILIQKGNINRYKFIINPNLNEPNEIVKTIYQKLKLGNEEIFFFSFIKDKNCTYVTIAGDDFDFENGEGDILRRDWNLKFGFSTCWNIDQDEITFVQEKEEWSKRKKKESKDIGPFDYFYLAEYFK